MPKLRISWMDWMTRRFKLMGVVACAPIVCAVFGSGEFIGVVNAQQHEKLDAIVVTSDVRVEVKAGSHAPILVKLEDGRKTDRSETAWRNISAEVLPDSVDIDGSSTPITWELKPESGSIDAHKVVFVYECTQPHLQLSWQWEARADFGPIEHAITV